MSVPARWLESWRVEQPKRADSLRQNRISATFNTAIVNATFFTILVVLMELAEQMPWTTERRLYAQPVIKEMTLCSPHLLNLALYITN